VVLYLLPVLLELRIDGHWYLFATTAGRHLSF
jgi:hypothetical protein